jgi:hypothetical protein
MLGHADVTKRRRVRYSGGRQFGASFAVVMTFRSHNVCCHGDIGLTKHYYRPNASQLCGSKTMSVAARSEALANGAKRPNGPRTAAGAACGRNSAGSHQVRAV